MDKKLLSLAAPIACLLGFNVFNASKEPMQAVAGKWSCVVTQPNGTKLKVNEMLNSPGDAWGGLTSTVTASTGQIVEMVFHYEGNWSASETNLTHRYKKVTLFSAKAGGVDVLPLIKDEVGPTLKRMKGKTRQSRITLATRDELRYEDEDGSAVCESVPY